MNYSDQTNSVRVDFFKPSGKWYTTEAVLWVVAYDEGLLTTLFQDLLKIHLVKNEKPNSIRLAGMWAVCLEPYHQHSHPLMTRVPGCYECGALVCTTAHQKDIL